MVLKEQTALITGGARGIGKAIAERLAADGADIAVVDIDLEQARSTASSIAESTGRKTEAYKCDVSDFGRVGEVVNKIVSAFGSIDILVNNAGITRDSLLMRMKPEDWDIVLAINLKGSFNFIQAASRQMMKQRSGSVINISSVVGLMGNPGQANYSASKAGLIGLTKSAAKEFAPRGVRVNAVAPGFIETELTAGLPDEVKKHWRETIPLGRGGTVQDVAAAVAFLAGPDSSYLTGQVLPVDGGMVM
ncbi:MAG: 3-oxoacyl-[acyl-carrier-protein] reductase [Candidatus Glassbacteria bacterium]|nr:3-oxoacyl-[acyl-carrier-protein] reductase [Candidatus Glassbacteria bacterium]